MSDAMSDCYGDRDEDDIFYIKSLHVDDESFEPNDGYEEDEDFDDEIYED